jgi:hypothetical protein
MTCLDEGTLQAYLDGELSPETLNGIAAHLAACAPCTEAARAAQEELALFSTAYTPALCVSVPTAKLRARLDEAIAELNTAPRPFATQPAISSRLRSFYESIVASLTTFTPRQATAFASFLVAVAFAVVAFVLTGSPDKPNASQDEIAKVTQVPIPAATINGTRGDEQTGRDQVEIQTPGDPSDAPVRINRRPSTSGVNFINASSPAPSGVARVNGGSANPVTATPKSEPVLEDEKTYLSSIASLSTAIEARGAEAMTPTLRAEYERNLAVVNQAIVSSRVAARQNPQDTDAKDFLRAAYQNKVELLSAIADQSQLASSRD